MTNEEKLLARVAQLEEALGEALALYTEQDGPTQYDRYRTACAALSDTADSTAWLTERLKQAHEEGRRAGLEAAETAVEGCLDSLWQEERGRCRAGHTRALAAIRALATTPTPAAPKEEP